MIPDTLARLIPESSGANGSWWINQPRDGWTARCEQELPRMKGTTFGRMLTSNLGSEYAAGESRNRKGTGMGAYRGEGL